MLEKIGMGISAALLAALVPNALSLAQPELPVTLLHQAMDKQSAELAATKAQLHVQGNTTIPVNGAMMLGHRLIYLHRVTAYNAVSWQTSSDPEMSACGPTRPNQIALSHDLFFRRNGSARCGEHVDILLSSGQVIHGVVWDMMNPRYHMAADILMSSIQRAVDFGVQRAELRIIPKGRPRTIDS